MPGGHGSLESLSHSEHDCVLTNESSCLLTVTGRPLNLLFLAPASTGKILFPVPKDLTTPWQHWLYFLCTIFNFIISLVDFLGTVS